jgi:hypothetical protein
MNCKIIKFVGLSWVSLGFYRGVKLYNYKYHHKNNEYIILNNDNNGKYKHCTDIEKMYSYSSALGSGIGALFIYGLPVFWPFLLTKEIYRIELYLNNLQEHTQDASYVTLFNFK